MMFKDRKEAGSLLAHELIQYRSKNAVVLALPRGGVPVAFEIAKKLKLPLDIFPVRKVGHPDNPEYALCAVDQDGNTLCNEEEIANVEPVWLKKEIEEQRQEALRRAGLYRGNKKSLNLSGKIVILVDDGVATGLTLRLAVKSLRRKGPGKIIVAVPISPKETADILKAEVDKLIVLEIPEYFTGSVGAYYESFSQVSDDEVISLITAAI
ncbi:MAG: phosphoribosyl transferase [Candidatus Zambryskibacteria bacterium RIFCSPLOWO2_12_FULL_39_16]|uniref:Phosphoribosyl transferase n=1 Tax=Candidatus Zambryskibacteria bacterium RIFCSPLOWO2_12_FULL_39_16 TaxID=1802775 RepID=A0A1G2UU84_9BACT|nr:MAG: phosphoribosyl transferase [Candidatus Zambryskibacteria bacterium RIFCSPLOWO2_12_FULL_39_16]